MALFHITKKAYLVIYKLSTNMTVNICLSQIRIRKLSNRKSMARVANSVR